MARMLGLIGSAFWIVFVVTIFAEEGIGDILDEGWLGICFLLSGLVVFNFFSANKDSNNLLGLWIQKKKAEFRKEIEEIEKK